MPPKFLLLAIILGFSCLGCCKWRPCDPVWEIPDEAIETEEAVALNSPLFALGEWPEIQWWKQFNDPQLEQLILQGLSLNPSMGIADAQMRVALAEAGIVGSALYPKINFDSDVTRFHQSATGLFGLFPAGTFPLTYTQSELYLSLQFEIDWWGKNRNALKSALGEVNARQIEAVAARITLGLQIAEAYFRYQIAQQRLLQARQLAANREENLQLISLRVQKNLSSDIDYNSAKNDLSTASAFMHLLEQDSIIQLHLLRALVAGQFEENPEPIELTSLTNLTVVLPDNLPLDLIAHRPDITAQIWRTDSAEKEVYVAKAQFYPNLNLLALGGLQTITFNKWFTNPSKYGNAGPAIHLPIFEGGALRANLSGKKDEYIIAVLEYENLVINAVQEVLDGISNVRLWNDRLTSLVQATESSKSTVDLTQQRMMKHLSSKIDLLDAEKQWLSDRDTQLQATGAGLVAHLSLIKAMGGGFFNPIAEEN